MGRLPAAVLRGFWTRLAHSLTDEKGGKNTWRKKIRDSGGNFQALPESGTYRSLSSSYSMTSEAVKHRIYYYYKLNMF